MRTSGSPRQAGTSHRVYRTPWPGDPRVNVQQSVVKPRVAPRSAMRALSKACRGNPCGCPVDSVGATLVVALFVSRNNAQQQNSAGNSRIQHGAAGCNVDPQMSARIGGFKREIAEFRGEAQNPAGIEFSGALATGCQDHNGMAKAYQVRQVLRAIEKLEAQHD